LERYKFSLIAIFHGIPEYAATQATDRIAEDIKLLDATLYPLSLSTPSKPKIFRICRITEGKSLPEKVVSQASILHPFF